ncbi:MAG: hypothetical protein IT426_20925 [Pirellulales bacterium]|nr:hypothetical protein [Pirellulales bacterium]
MNGYVFFLLKTIVEQAVRLPPPFVRAVRNGTAANDESIGFVVRDPLASP